jgi:bifunctional non-homologous end joining protein LigD
MSPQGEASARKLERYRSKRRFDGTPEPEGADAPGPTGARFVVHEHHARRLHWDLRLERDGTLASWAIPNGIPDDPKHNRKAIHVEDHPLSYIEFEGTIPDGHYGAGKVSVWDRGTYACEKWEARKLVVVFHGERLRGRYSLFQTGGAEKDWMIHRMGSSADPDAQEMPEFVEPMLARLSTLPTKESDWGFEVKWDGVRAIAHSQPGRIRLASRNGNDISLAYPELRGLNGALGSHTAILDGEIVAFDELGRPSFEALQPRMHQRGEASVRRHAQTTPVTYVVFDLLWLDGDSLMDLSYRERRARLEALELDGERWCTPGFQAGEGWALLAATREQGLEGVVAKRLDSRYAPGRRDAGWLKIKHANRQEVVIGGWTEGKGSRSARIGALHMGVYDDDEQGALRYAGRVGSGFDQAELERLARRLEPLARESSPFVGQQPPRGAHFVEPRLVCEVEFAEWTRDGLLRHPAYKGLREDKPATAVTRERTESHEERPTREGGPAAGGESADCESLAHPQESAHEEGLAHGGNTDRRGDTATASTGGDASGLRELIEDGRGVRDGVEVVVEGRTLKLTNLDKPIYPKSGFTKRDLIDHYFALAPTLLPHLKGRPLTLKRYPNGVEQKHFYEKQCPRHHPEWVQTATIWSESNKREIHFCLCEDLPTLVWVANLAAVELHPSLSLAEEMGHPSVLAFDLDPGPPAGVLECCEVALLLREMFVELDMQAFAKTSGLKGLQVYVPLNDREATYEQTKPFAHAVADLLERRHPQLVVSRMAKVRRAGKVLVDWNQNDEHKTTVAVYSLRANESPTVSTPVGWEEVERCRDAHSPALLDFQAEQAQARVLEHGDLFAPVVSLRQSLPEFGG